MKRNDGLSTVKIVFVPDLVATEIRGEQQEIVLNHLKTLHTAPMPRYPPELHQATISGRAVLMHFVKSCVVIFTKMVLMNKFDV